MTRFPLRIESKKMETPDTVSLRFAVPQDLTHLFQNKPGQFVSLALSVDDEELERSYSISSLPTPSANLRITVKRVADGRASNWLVDQTREGDLLEVSTPRGRFFEPPTSSIHAVLLGAGSGVAPLLPIARHLLSQGLHRVSLVCGQRTEEDIILRGDFEALADDPNVSVGFRLSRPGENWSGGRGRVNADFVASQLPVWLDGGLPSVFYLCGPEAFMQECEKALLLAGVSPDAIRKESFALAALDDSDEPGITVKGEDQGEVGTCVEVTGFVMGEEVKVAPEAGETLLATLLRSDAEVPHSCQEGTCASCIARVKSGAVEVRPATLQVLPQKDLDSGLILACLARPMTKSVCIDFDDL